MTPEESALSPHDIATTLAGYALEKKAVDPVILFVEPLLSYCGHFVIVSATNSRQVRAIANHVAVRMKDEGVMPLSTEGTQSGKWVLIDFGDVVFHVFEKDMRGFYDLDGLWSDAERIEIPGHVATPQAAFV